MATVSLSGLHKTFGSTEAVRGVDLEVAEEEFVVLVGPSGCGKSTILRMIAGLEESTSGEIRIAGERVNERPPKDRNVAMVFQNYALYPHMTVSQNMSFGLRLRKYPRSEIHRRVTTAAKTLGLEDLLERRPRQLSGGQRQRVAMGRAIVRNPSVFLFDEPLSNLDAKLRSSMRIEIKRVHQRMQATTIYVTHDQVEAMTLADRVVVMRDGRIDQAGPPDDLYHRPRTRFVAGFIGSPEMNFISCQLEGKGEALAVKVGDALSLPVPPDRRTRYEAHQGQTLVLGIRPEHIREPRGEGGVQVDVQVDIVEPLGVETMVYFKLDGVEFCGRVAPNLQPAPGARVVLSLDAEHMHLIDPRTDQVL